MTEMPPASRLTESRPLSHPPEERNLYLTLTLIMQVLLVIGLVIFLIRGNWENVFLTAVVVALTLLPAFLFRRYRVIIPPEFELVAVAFNFLSLFLGSALDFYYHFWWWDVVLHTASGFLLGIIGFVALFVLNQTDRVRPAMKPGFIAFFGVTFAVTLGVAWETFEFAVDRMWPHLNMQSLETGVVDTIGAVIVAVMGYAYLKTGRYSFIADAVQKFVRKNPELLGKRKPQAAREDVNRSNPSD